MYEKEAVDEEAKLEKMKADGRDVHDVKKQVQKVQCRGPLTYSNPLKNEVLEESRNMIPDCQRRLKTAYTDLQLIIVRRVPTHTPPQSLPIITAGECRGPEGNRGVPSSKDPIRQCSHQRFVVMYRTHKIKHKLGEYADDKVPIFYLC